MSSSFSRKKFLKSAFAASSILLVNSLTPNTALASECLPESNIGRCPLGYPPDISPEEYIAFIENNGGSWITYYLDENDEINTYTSASIEKDTDFRSVSSLPIRILIFLKDQLIGYLFCTAVDGVIKSITGKSGSELVSEAIPYLLGHRVPSDYRYTLPSSAAGHGRHCDIYPPNSWAYWNCMNN